MQLVRSPRNGGYAAGVNLGARHSTPGHDLLVLNPDTRVRAGAVDALRSALAVPGTGIAVPRLLHPDGSTAFSQRRRPTLLRALGEAVLGGERAGRVGTLGEIVVDPAMYTTPCEVVWASGAAMLVDRRCHDALHGWDESFFLYAEETDLCLRAADLGWRTRYAPDAVVEHIGGHGERTRAARADDRQQGRAVPATHTGGGAGSRTAARSSCRRRCGPGGGRTSGRRCGGCSDGRAGCRPPRGVSP